MTRNRVPHPVRLLAACVVFAAGGSACDERRERPRDLPPGPYAQSDEIPDRYQQSGVTAPIYVVERIDGERVHLLPADAAPRGQRAYRQGDPVSEFVVTREDFRTLAGTEPATGMHVELHPGPVGRPERLVVREPPGDRE